MLEEPKKSPSSSIFPSQETKERRRLQSNGPSLDPGNRKTAPGCHKDGDNSFCNMNSNASSLESNSSEECFTKDSVTLCHRHKIKAATRGCRNSLPLEQLFFIIIFTFVTLTASLGAAAKSSHSPSSSSPLQSSSSFHDDQSAAFDHQSPIQVRSSPEKGTASIILNPSRIRSSLKSLVLDPFLALASNAFQKDPTAQLSLNLPSSDSASVPNAAAAASSSPDYEYTDSASEAISKVVPSSSTDDEEAAAEGEKAVAAAAATDPEVAKLLSQGSSPFYVLEPAPLPGMLQPYPFAPAIPAGAQLIHPAAASFNFQPASAMPHTPFAAHSSPYATYMSPYGPATFASFPNSVAPAAAAAAVSARKSSTSSSAGKKKVIVKKSKKAAVKSSIRGSGNRKSVSSSGRSITIGGAEGGG